MDPDRIADRRFEDRLAELRRKGQEGSIDLPGVRPNGSPMPDSPSPDSPTGYYGLPLLKPPVWTWEVPTYFFVGGVAGSAAVIAVVARLAGAPHGLVRDARWLAAGGAVLSAPLLVADLGRPSRFLYMLRVFKPRSPMSVGVWTLVAFSSASSAALLADMVQGRRRRRGPMVLVSQGADVLSAVTGLALATYTGVLLGVTAIPVWSRSVRLLPIHFGISGLGAAASALEICGHRHRALRLIGIGAATAESAIGAHVERDSDPALDPLKHGWSGTITRLGGVLAGPVPLALRVFGGRSPAARRAAVISTLAGSLLTRIAWVAAGRESARTPASAERESEA